MGGGLVQPCLKEEKVGGERAFADKTNLRSGKELREPTGEAGGEEFGKNAVP